MKRKNFVGDNTHCTRCNEKLNPKRTVWLELNSSTGTYHEPGTVPAATLTRVLSVRCGVRKAGSDAGGEQVKSITIRLTTPSRKAALSLHDHLILVFDTYSAVDVEAVAERAAVNRAGPPPRLAW